MITELDRRLNELRFIEGIEKVEHVPYQANDQFWVRFRAPFDLAKLNETVEKHGFVMVPFAGLPSKLPRGLAEMLWNGVTHVITKRIDGWSRLTSKFGFEPDGIAKLAVDLHGPYRIFIATSEEGIQLLYEYLGVKYMPPAPPPPKPSAAPTKPPPPTVAKSTQPAAPQPAAPAAAPTQAVETTSQSQQAPKSSASQPAAEQENKKEAPQAST